MGLLSRVGILVEDYRTTLTRKEISIKVGGGYFVTQLVATTIAHAAEVFSLDRQHN